MIGEVLKPRAAATAMLLAVIATQATAQQTIPGTFALAGADPAVAGQIEVTETAPLAATLKVTFSDARTGQPITEFTEELTQELHLLAVDSSLSTLVHEHVKAATPAGLFDAEMRFPEPGTYHVYADTVPAGLGQQVLRFDVSVGDEGGAERMPVSQRFGVKDTIMVSSGPYEVEVDASALAANNESMLLVHISKNGEPAPDLRPYLGVAAHAVLIKVQDLSYVHAHPTEDLETGDTAVRHGDHATGHHAPAASSAHEHGHASPSATVSSDMTLHLTPPGPGAYALFLEFIGGDEIHTINVPLELSGS